MDLNCQEKIRAHLALLYPDCVDEVLGMLTRRMDETAATIPAHRASWDQTDAVLITYGDQVAQKDVAPLETQRKFLLERGLGDVLSTVHILPFFPYSSDDGFSVIDYRQVDPALGDWSDVASLGESFDLMFDLVINHCSRHSEWFKKYLYGEEPYTSYFIEVDPQEDLSQVTRPRSHPLLTPYATSRGTRSAVCATVSS